MELLLRILTKIAISRWIHRRFISPMIAGLVRDRAGMSRWKGCSIFRAMI